MSDQEAARRRAVGAASTASIAVLEDDDAFREDILRVGLVRHGFLVETFAHSSELYRRLLSTSFDAIVLDIGLIDEDGLSVARQLRDVSPLGIVVLTGRHDVKKSVEGFSDAVDVWLSKPVDMDFMTATIDALLRRMRAGSDVLRDQPRGWSVSSNGWHLHAPSGDYVALTQSERCVVERLIAAAGEPVSRAQLIADLGECEHDFDPHRLEMLIHRLRRKVAERFDEPFPLNAVRGRGYVLLGTAGNASH